jgi:hypothetical protein
MPEQVKSAKRSISRGRKACFGSDRLYGAEQKFASAVSMREQRNSLLISRCSGITKQMKMNSINSIEQSKKSIKKLWTWKP